MTASEHPSEVYVIRYQRSKALGFGAAMLGIGSAIAWLALDTLWHAPIDDGAVLQTLPSLISVPILALVAGILLTPGLMMVWAGLTNRIIVRADAEVISSRTIFGRSRTLRWLSIGSVKRWGRENQIVLSPIGYDGLAAEIWDRKSVLIDAGMLERSVAEVEEIIRHFRPDLSVSYRESREGG